MAFAALAVAAMVGIASIATAVRGRGGGRDTEVDFVRAVTKNGDGIKSVQRSVDGQHETLRDQAATLDAIRDGVVTTNAKLETLIGLTRHNGSR